MLSILTQTSVLQENSEFFHQAHPMCIRVYAPETQPRVTAKLSYGTQLRKLVNPII